MTSITSQYAWALFHDVEITTRKPIVSPEMEARRGVPDDPEYFDCLDAIEEFLSCLGDLGTANHKES